MAANIIEYGKKEETIKRKHCRIGCLWNISFQESVRGQEDKEEKTWFKAVITDVSGGGCRFNFSRKMEKGSILILKIAGKEKELLFKAEVIESQLLANRKETYETRIQFVEISFEEQEQLIKWIFEEKRKIRWRERGSNYEEKYFDY